MKISQLFKKQLSIGYSDLPAEKRKKIIKEAVRRANEEQYEMVKAYRENRCNISN